MTSDKVQPMPNGQNQGGNTDNIDMKDAHRLDLPTDKLSNGPVMDRSCTDVICCLLFIAFCLGMTAAAAYGWANGNPMLLLTGWDYDGNGCGYNTTTQSYPYLYWPAPDVTNISGNAGNLLYALKYSMCVSSCPQNDTSTPVYCHEPSFFVTNANKFQNCQYYPTAYTTSGGTTVYGSPFRYNTMQVMGKYCLPDDEALKNATVKAFNDVFYDKYDIDKYSNYVQDVIRVWYVMAICVGTAFVFGILYLLLLRCFAGLMIWLTIIAIIVLIGGGGVWAYMYRNHYNSTDNNYKYLEYGAYALWGIDGLFVLLVLCCCSRIRLAVAIMKVTSQFIYGTPTVLLIPVIFLIICGVWVAVWCCIAVYLMSMGQIEPRDPPLQFISTIKWDTQTRYIFLYHLFGGLWVNAFIIGCSQFIIAAACAVWYFSFTSDTSGRGSLWTGIKWILRYHFGSIAFGSCIIAIVQFIRIIFEYYRQKIQKANKNNPVVKCLLCTTSYCLACLERCIKFITKNAYIQVALTSKNFCRSAWNAFILIVKNAFRFGAVHSIGAIFMFLGRLLIIAANAVICYIMVTQWPKAAQSVSTPYFPCIVAGIIGYLIGAIFMSIFSFASDTILQCFLLDEELNEQGKGRPPSNRPPIMNEFVSRANGGSGCCCCC